MYLQAVNAFELQDIILHSNESKFEQIALELFRYQANHNQVYSEFIGHLGIHPDSVTSWLQIPFLPVETFKYRTIKTGIWDEACVFESSGTTQGIASKHYIKSLEWYHNQCIRSFEFHFGDINQYEFFGLLPHYLERKHSSLVEMVRHFMHVSNEQHKDAFYQHDFAALYHALSTSDFSNKRPVIFGVSFALLDFAEAYTLDMENSIIIETGGMKGRRREIQKSQLIDALRSSFPYASIWSEYGMAELHDQAYAFEDGLFRAPEYLKFCTSDPSNPLKIQDWGERGLINVIDLGNIHSVAFIQTGDIGRVFPNGELELLGRSDVAELRGCVQLYEQ